jgi:hypothetical protein
MSIFVIWSLAAMTRCAFAGSGPFNDSPNEMYTGADFVEFAEGRAHPESHDVLGLDARVS